MITIFSKKSWISHHPQECNSFKSKVITLILFLSLSFTIEIKLKNDGISSQIYVFCPFSLLNFLFFQIFLKSQITTEKGSSQCVKINIRKKKNINKWEMCVATSLKDLERQKINPFTLQCAFFGYFSFYYPFFLGILCYSFSLKNKSERRSCNGNCWLFLCTSWAWQWVKWRMSRWKVFATSKNS